MEKQTRFVTVAMYTMKRRYYNPVMGRFISSDDTSYIGDAGEKEDLSSFNLYNYCGNNPVSRVDSDGAFWELAVAGGGAVSSFGMSFGALLTGLSAIAPVIVAVAVVVVVSEGIKSAKPKTKSKDEKEQKEQKKRVNEPIARRNTYNTRKKAKEAAQRAGGGKKPRHDPKGNPEDRRPHYHPDVKDRYRKTPHGASMHDHYYYPR